MRTDVPIHEKYVLSIEEAAAYFHIGQNRLRGLTAKYKDAEWVLWVQTHAMIKRRKFEEYIDSVNSI